MTPFCRPSRVVVAAVVLAALLASSATVFGQRREPPPPPLTPIPTVPDATVPIVGWSLFVGGTLGAIVFGSLHESSKTCEVNESETMVCTREEAHETGQFVSGVAALVGLGVAVYGHWQRGTARARLRRWKRYHKGAALYESDDGTTLTLEGTRPARGADGLALTLRF